MSKNAKNTHFWLKIGPKIRTIKDKLKNLTPYFSKFELYLSFKTKKMSTKVKFEVKKYAISENHILSLETPY